MTDRLKDAVERADYYDVLDIVTAAMGGKDITDGVTMSKLTAEEKTKLGELVTKEVTEYAVDQNNNYTTFDETITDNRRMIANYLARIRYNVAKEKYVVAPKGLSSNGGRKKTRKTRKTRKLRKLRKTRGRRA